MFPTLNRIYKGKGIFRFVDHTQRTATLKRQSIRSTAGECNPGVRPERMLMNTKRREFDTEDLVIIGALGAFMGYLLGVLLAAWLLP